MCIYSSPCTPQSTSIPSFQNLPPPYEDRGDIEPGSLMEPVLLRVPNRFTTSSRVSVGSLVTTRARL